jgi:hypothetical protein
VWSLGFRVQGLGLRFTYPGPLTRAETTKIFFFRHAWPMVSPHSCAAYAVARRDPLNPALPPDDHASVSPSKLRI